MTIFYYLMILNFILKAVLYDIKRFNKNDFYIHIEFNIEDFIIRSN